MSGLLEAGHGAQREVGPGGRLRPVPRPGRDIVLVLVAVGALVGVFLALGAYTERPFSYFAKEPAETFAAPKYVGAFAHTLVLMWAAAATTALVAGSLHLLAGQHRVAALHLSAGALTVLLLVDDFFMFHESLYLRLGLSQEVVYGAYVMLAVAFVVVFRTELLHRGMAPMIVVAGAFFAVSVGLDIVVPVPETVHVLEDGTKAVGIAMWTVAIVRAAVGDLRPTFAP